LRTGKSYCDPQRLFSKQYKTIVEQESVEEDGQLTAETFLVSVEQATVFVEL
jgi:hypothetical protein